MSRKKCIVIIFSLTVIFSVISFYAGYRTSISGKARQSLAQQILKLNSVIEEYGDAKVELEKQIEETDSQLDEKSDVNDEFIEYKTENDELKSANAELEAKSAELDSAIEEAESKAKSGASVSESKGMSYKTEKDKIYSCPDDLPAGRYKASGGSTLIIYSKNGKIRETVGLDTAYDNSYTFNLSEGERVKTDGAATLTELKEN